jgi:phage gpG-like protein
VTALRWDEAEVMRLMELRLERALMVAAQVVVLEAKRSMGETGSGANVPAGHKTYGEKSKRPRVKGFGTRRSAPGQPPAVQTGNLANSIGQERMGRLWRRVGTNVKYGYWMEVGVPGGKIIKPKKGKALAWVGPDGETIIRRQVRQGKIAARPWLRPALMRAQPAIARRLAGLFRD